MLYGACQEIRLRDEIVVGPESSPEWGVRITQLASGDEDRTEVWSQPRRRLRLSFGRRDDAVQDEILEFFMALGGPASTFTVCDPTDNTAPVKTLWYDLADVPEDDRTIWTQEAGGILVPLHRGYEAGPARRYRRITKPRPLGFRCWLNNTEITHDVTVDFGRGTVLMDFLPTKGRLYFAGKYDLCVRLDGPLKFKQQHMKRRTLDDVSLIECLGEEDYAPANETAEMMAALGRSEDELSALIAYMQELAAT